MSIIERNFCSLELKGYIFFLFAKQIFESCQTDENEKLWTFSNFSLSLSLSLSLSRALSLSKAYINFFDFIVLMYIRDRKIGNFFFTKKPITPKVTNLSKNEKHHSILN